MNIWLKYGALVVASYLWGSVCWGLVLSFVVKHEDIRLKDNPGLSGSVRQYGWGYGLTVGLLDVMKGYLLSLVLRSMSLPSWVLIASFMAVIVGHNWPVFFQFRGGGCLLYTSDAADDLLCVDLGGRRIIKKKKKTARTTNPQTTNHRPLDTDHAPYT